MIQVNREESTIKILIADDREEHLKKTRDILMGMFSEENVYIREVRSAEQGELIMSREGEPDLLITDGWMPNKGDGIRLANKAKEMYPKLPIILLTAEPPADGTLNIDFVVKKSNSANNADLEDKIKILLGLK